jgi:hypothetical protein
MAGKQYVKPAGDGPAIPNVTVNLHDGSSEHISSRLDEVSARAGRVLGVLDVGLVHLTCTSSVEMRALAHEALRLTYLLEQTERAHAAMAQAS